MPRKLGQHFLKNTQIARKIANSLEIQPQDRVVEIGGGTGKLTKELATEVRSKKQEARLFVIEKDIKYVSLLQEQYQDIATIIHGDALETLPSLILTSSFSSLPYKLIGNIPYYITGKLLRTLSELKRKPSSIVLMIQKEVAERVCAKPPKMNLLAASVQAWADVEVLFSVSKSEFKPAPKVDSAVVRLTPHDSRKDAEEDAEEDAESRGRYYEFIKALFQQPRKTIVNNLSAGYGISKEEVVRLLGEFGVDGRARPHDLDITLIKNLSQIV